MHRPRLCNAACAVVLVTVIGVTAAACSGSKSKAPATPDTTQAAGDAGTPRPTATPTPAPADPKLGDKLRTEGEFEAAIGVYASVAAKSNGQQQQEARLAQAQLLVRTGRLADARAVLDTYLAAAGADGDASEARYMLASALDDLGDLQGAVGSYERYIAAGGVLSDFARIERAKLLARLGRVPDAEVAAAQVLAGTQLLDTFRSSFIFSMGRAFEQGHADVNALAWYQRAEIETGDLASALARAGAVKKRLGDPTWSADYLRAVNGYPESGVAPDLLGELDAAAVPVSDYVRGVIDYRASRNDAARAALQRAIAAGDHAAEAAYYLAALDERLGDKDVAIAGYQRAHDLNPASPLADSALWWRARLLEQAGRYDDASAAYAALVQAYPSSKWAADAAFHRGLARYRAGDYAGAAEIWGALASSADGEDLSRARYWQARALNAEHDPMGDQVLAQLVNQQSGDLFGDYYALRAEVLLGKNDAKDRKPKLNAQAADWDKIAKYVRQTAGVDPEASPTPDDARWAVGAALEDVGLHNQSDAVYRSILRDNGGEDVVGLYQAAKRFDSEGRTSLAARAATTLATVTQEPGGPPPPDDLLRVAYPLAYGDLASTAAKDEGISPLLLLSLVRQESFFDPEAGSGAGALGLTQVIPATGEAIAATLGVTNFSADDLYRPKLSLAFGASYLSAQLKQFDDDPYRALAAYNGGPATAADAITAAGDDNDLFVEDLEFDETRQYVRRVMENYARYRQLYEGLDRASLPQ